MRHYYIFVFILFICCKGNRSDSDEIYDVDEFESVYGYEDGTYCAEVEYYYSNTGTRSTYTLEVEIENNELTVIHWPNGGWLDSSHFSPPDISDGQASFTSDAGVDYDVTIIGGDGECNTDNYAKNESDLIDESEDGENRIRKEEENRIEEEERREQEESEESE